MKSRLRFTIALTVALVLGGSLLYFSLGGQLQAYVSPAELLTSAPGQVYRLDGIVAPQKLSNPQDEADSPQGLQFWVQDKENTAVRVEVSYTGEVPDAFKVGREVVLTGTRDGTTFVAQRNSMITMCPSKFVNKPDPPPLAATKS
jgi:cytochrome c-type biogenesis protein CcmE